MTPAQIAERRAFHASIIRERVELRDGRLHWIVAKKPVKYQMDRYGYYAFNISYRGGRFFRFSVHRVIWLLHYGEWPQHTIDHINRIRTDNRLENLRDVPIQENCRNTVHVRHYGPGVRIDPRLKRNPWRAEINRNGRRFYVGQFPTREAAVAAREEAVRKLADILSAPRGGRANQTPRVCPPHLSRAT